MDLLLISAFGIKRPAKVWNTKTLQSDRQSPASVLKTGEKPLQAFDRRRELVINAKAKTSFIQRLEYRICGNSSISSFMSLLVAPCDVTECTNRFGCVEAGTTKHLERSLIVMDQTEIR
ncbi:hypothetical protein YC2023_118900 [Brassica napus]